MIIVIQCAASKRAGAGHLTTASGKPVDFVADPLAAPSDPARLYARPDDLSDTGISWRQVLLNYNAAPHGNPRGLYPAYQLYANKAWSKIWEQNLGTVFPSLTNSPSAQPGLI